MYALYSHLLVYLDLQYGTKIWIIYGFLQWKRIEAQIEYSSHYQYFPFKSLSFFSFFGAGWKERCLPLGLSIEPFNEGPRTAKKHKLQNECFCFYYKALGLDVDSFFWKTTILSADFVHYQAKSSYISYVHAHTIV